MEPLLLVLVALALSVFALVILVAFLLLARPWLRALLHGTPVLLTQIVGMRLRGNRPALLIDAYIRLRHSGAKLTIQDVERVYITARTRVQTSDDLVVILEQRQAASAAGAAATDHAAQPVGL